MKKLALALVCMVSVAFFASCTQPVEHPEPSISFVAGEGTYTQDAVINTGEIAWFNIKAMSNVETNKLLKTFYFQVFTGDERYDDTLFTEINQTYFDYYIGYEFGYPGIYTISATVTDADGYTATCQLNLTVIQNVTPLTVVDTKWVRRGANITEGEAQLAELGLQWTGSYKEIFATLKPAEGYNLYQFDANWDEIETDLDKQMLFTAAMEIMHPLESFREITTAHSSDYDAIIGTVKDGEMHLMHITRCDVETGSYGTQLTITGQAK